MLRLHYLKQVAQIKHHHLRDPIIPQMITMRAVNNRMMIATITIITILINKCSNITILRVIMVHIIKQKLIMEEGNEHFHITLKITLNPSEKIVNNITSMLITTNSHSYKQIVARVVTEQAVCKAVTPDHQQMNLRNNN